jgi:hypothetical protein
MAAACATRAVQLFQGRVMDRNTDELPSAAVKQDSAEGKAPNPGLHYDSPETLAEDVELDLANRADLLLEWKYGLEQQLEAVSEGMGTSGPGDAPEHARMAAELRRVAHAHEAVSHEIELAGGTRPAPSASE